MKYQLWTGLFAAVLALGSASDSTLTQEPPPIEHAAKPEGVDPGSIWLVPGLPLGPRKPDLSQSPVGFLDSGIQADHPQLKGLIVAERDFTGEGLQDDFQHGTVVALVFVKGFLEVGDTKPPPGIISAKVVGKKTVPVPVTVQRMIAAIEWLKSQKVRLVNISLALAGSPKDFAPLCEAIAAQKDILFPVAAGNGGAQDVVYPAHCKASNELVTGAVTTDEKHVAAYSGKGEIYANGHADVVRLYEYHLLEGDRLAGDGKYDEAQAAYERALASSPPQEGMARIQYGLGFVSLKTDKPDRALQDFLAAIKNDPQLPEPYVAASVILTNREDYQGAWNLLQSGLAAGVDTPRLRDRAARVLLDLDRPREAKEQIDALDHLDPKFDGLEELKLAAHNRILILDHLDKDQNAQALFWSFLGAGDADLVAFLTRHAKLDLNAVPDGAKVPPIVRAAAMGQTAIVTALLKAGSKVDGTNPGNRITALMTAANAGHASLVQILLDAGASIDATDDFGYTPLMFAAEQGKLECAQILLKHSASLLPKSQEGKTAFDYARQHGHVDIAAEIESALKTQSPAH